MDGVGTPIIGRPRPLPGHDTPNPAHNTYTLKCEEPYYHPLALQGGLGAHDADFLAEPGVLALLVGQGVGAKS